MAQSTPPEPQDQAPGKVWKALESGDNNGLQHAIAAGYNVNQPASDWGETILFHAILKGNAAVVKLLLEVGADPNYPAPEPAATIWASTPVSLAMQARNIMDWNKFNPIVQLLFDFGGKDFNGKRETKEEEENSRFTAPELERKDIERKESAQQDQK